MPQRADKRASGQRRNRGKLGARRTLVEHRLCEPPFTIWAYGRFVGAVCRECAGGAKREAVGRLEAAAARQWIRMRVDGNQ